MFLEHEFATDDAILGYVEGPASGPPLLLLHGVTRCWQDFAPLLPALAARWQIYGLDFRGHGRSRQTAAGYRVVDYAREAVRFLREQIARPAVVLGHSLGAMVASHVASHAPEHVIAAVLEDPPFETLGERIRETHFHAFFSGMQALIKERRSVPELVAALAQLPVTGEANGPRLGDARDAASLRFSARCLSKLDPAVLEPLVEGRWLEDYRQQQVLTGISCPMLLLQADMQAGGMLTDEDAGQVDRLVGDCTTVRFANVGHLIHWDDMPRMLRAVLGFLESVDWDRS